MSDERFVFPTSFAQRRLWFVDQLEPESAHYNVPMALALSGSLDVSALHRGLVEIVGRHEALRTTFVLRDGEPMQIIGPHSDVELPVVDATALSDTEVQRWIEDEARRPFDLERGPLLRARLLRRGAGEHVLLLTVHHIVFDGWSVGVLFRELSECYCAFASGGVPRLPALPVQYGDYSVWQRNWLKGETLERQRAYWRTHLAGAPPTLELPTDRPRPRIRSYRGSTETLWLSPRVLRGLTALSRQEGATLFMTLLAGFQALLARYAGVDDITVGSPIANRTRIELEQLIGFFVNSLALRTDLTGDPSFRELLGRVREVTVGAFDHQDLPFEKLVEELQPERVGDRNPIFQVMFALQNAPHPPLRLPGLTLRNLRRRTGRSKFDLVLNARETEQGLRVELEYSTDLFEAGTIRRMLGHLELLFEGVLAAPGRRLSVIPLLSGEERRQVLADWNRTDRPYPGDRGVHHLFEAQAAQHPGVTAVEAAGERLTYRELNGRANQLARFLRRQGMDRDARVAVALERSPDLVVAFLGVLKAGAAYVPLDPSYPADRVGLMLEDARASVLVTRAGLLPRVPTGVTSVRLDLDGDTISQESEDNLGVETSPEQLAYVMYTSGSTGRPKGIAIPHRAIVRLVCNADYVQLTPGDRVAQISNASFDAATFELWGALLHGARLIIIPREVVLSPRDLAVEIRDRGISAMFLTTALFNQLARDHPGVFRSVRHLLFGGEAVDPGRVRDVLGEGPPERLLHVYGPTETTTFATWHLVREVAEDAATVPIGAPIGNTRAHVLDSNLEPVPVGVAGELYLGGPGLARGYLDRPALTAERFVPDPHGSEPGGRLYRTGDRVRRRPDGALEFLGRFDDQIKLRGFRIEPGEVEAALAQHPAVGECAVILRDDLPVGRGLVAYLARRQVSNGDGPVRASESPQDHTTAWRQLREEVCSRSLANRPEPVSEPVDRTVERLLRRGPRRVLEIGCGSGELLLRVAPHCIRYVGTESSAIVLSQLRARVGAAGLADRVRLLQREPADLGGFERESADLVILNSVTQYLPTIDHLVGMLDSLTRVLAPRGAIFLGDVRNLELLDAFHASVELPRAPVTLPTGELHRRIRRRAEAENELLIAPRVFMALPQHLHQIRWVEAMPKRGRADGECTRFRYDVILHATLPAAAPEPAPAWRDWDSAGSLEILGRVLREDRPSILALGRVPNARTAAHAWTALALAAAGAPATAGELTEAGRAAAGSGVDPETLCELGEELGYRVELSWARCDSSGRFDVLFQRARDRAATWPVEQPATLMPWHSYANQPWLKRATEGLVPALRAHLRDRLPDFMIPAAFVVLDALPLSPNGKLDRRALPPPDEHASARDASFVAPRTPVENTLALLWQEVLGVEAVGLEDNFFELGGHSLLAVKLFAAVERTFDRKLPLSTLFQAPSLGRLADVIAQSSPSCPDSTLAVLQPHGWRPPLFLVHGVYGDVLEYRDLVNRLGPDQPVYGIEAGPDDGEAILRTIDQLASSYVEQVRRQEPTGPYYLCGYCWAGALTFEIAHQLRRAGEEVALLALIDAPCPGKRGPIALVERVERRSRNLSARIFRNLRRLRELQATTVPRFLWERVVRLATELGGVPAFRWSARLQRPLLPAFRGRRQAFLYAARSYRPALYPGRLTLFRACASSPSTERDPLWGWDRVAAGGVELHRVVGEHHELMKEPTVGCLAATLQACLERTQSNSASAERRVCGSRP